MISIESLSSIFLQSDKELLDITDLVTGVDIYQNIYEPFVTGSLSLIDYPSSRISKLFKETVIGKGEEISFGLKTKTLPASKDNELIFQRYHVYKVHVVPMESTGEDGMFKQTIVLNFSSEVMFLNEFKKVGEFYYDTISNIVTKIADNYLNIKELEIEETKDKQFIQIPFMTPLTAINWLTTRAFITSNNNESNKSQDKSNEKINNNFVFYEDIDHRHHFISIASLLARKPVLGTKDTDGIRLETAPSESAQGKVTYKGSYAAIQHISKPISPFSNAKNGMYSSTCLTFDLTRKKYAKQIENYGELFKKQTHLYDEPLLNPALDEKLNPMVQVYTSPQTYVKYYPKSSYLYSPNENVINGDNPTNTVNRWVLPRISSMEAMDQVGIDVEIRGNVGIRLGDVINFSRPQLDYTNELTAEGYDPLFTGKFLITKIKHTLENRGGNFGFNLRTSLSLRRDSKYSPSGG